MAILHKEYHKLPESASTDLKPGTEIRMTIGYRKGGITWATSQRVESGYYVSVTPVVRTDMGGGLTIEESGAFTGFNDTLCEYDRQSAKRLKEAIQILEQRKGMYLSKFIKVTEEI